MNFLELKMPPPVVALMVGAAMWGLSLITPLVQVPWLGRILAAIAIAAVGGAISLAGEIRFFRAKTTANPMKPQAASSLVTSGVYQYTRNPMYMGLLWVIVAWAVYLAAPWALIGPVVFVLYITRFQIIPEERALSRLFGAEYAAYQARVRRWL